MTIDPTVEPVRFENENGSVFYTPRLKHDGMELRFVRSLYHGSAPMFGWMADSSANYWTGPEFNGTFGHGWLNVPFRCKTREKAIKIALRAKAQWGIDDRAKYRET